MNPLRKVKPHLMSALVERDVQIDCFLRALVANEHLLLLGKPGCAKSLLAILMAKALGDKAFTVLLTKSIDPDEIFGPMDLGRFRDEGVMVRAMEGYAPSTPIVVYEEVFKGSVAALNTTLTHLMERVIYERGKAVPTPLITAVGCSNEWPTEMEETAALQDRFLIRAYVEYVSRHERRRLLYGQFPPITQVAEIQDVLAAQNEALAIGFSDESMDTMDKILDELTVQGICPSDRRMRKSVQVAKAEAWLKGHQEVAPSDLECLQDVLWDQPSQRDKAIDIIVKIANPIGATIMQVLREMREAETLSSKGTDEAIGAVARLEELQKQLEHLKDGNGRAEEARKQVAMARKRVVAKAMGIKEEHSL